MNGMPPHIAQLILGHRDINTTMGYKAVYPEEAINGHRAFIARRRDLRPSEEYRSPTDEEWEEFLGHFEHRKVALGDCGRAYGTSCVHEHSCVRCPLLRVDPAQRLRLVDIRDNLIARIAEAQREGWAGEAEGLKVSLAAANAKLAQVDGTIARRDTAVGLGMPTFPEIAGREATPRHDLAHHPHRSTPPSRRGLLLPGRRRGPADFPALAASRGLHRSLHHRRPRGLRRQDCSLRRLAGCDPCPRHRRPPLFRGRATDAQAHRRPGGRHPRRSPRDPHRHRQHQRPTAGQSCAPRIRTSTGVQQVLLLRQGFHAAIRSRRRLR
ncbi:hypothetical protein [Kitasatospora aureofaciens]|uniref:hypothetical protein n=1 Tax=Kitasatospora aureofaciens TaxID=1894 RepID=UPI0027DFC471|nr:hypothetical protein [Kitasatospora aureofaciens]